MKLIFFRSQVTLKEGSNSLVKLQTQELQLIFLSYYSYLYSYGLPGSLFIPHKCKVYHLESKPS